MGGRLMEAEVRYRVYRFYKGEKQLIGTYSDPMDAHAAAKRYDIPQAILQIEKITVDRA